MEVRREGSLLKKGGIGQQFKPRHFVCTRAGFLHYFDSKFDLTPKGSIPLHQVALAHARTYARTPHAQGLKPPCTHTNMAPKGSVTLGQVALTNARTHTHTHTHTRTR